MPATIAEPARGLFRRAKAAMSRPNAAEKLQAALVELRAILNQQRSGEQEANRVIAALSGCTATAQEAASKAWGKIEAGDADYDAIREWAIAQVVIERVREISINLQRSRYHNDPQKQALALNPNARGILLKVVELRLAIARDELERVRAAEQARLDQAHGAGEYDAADSQPVKRVARSVERLQKVQQRITDEPIEQTWPLFAKEMSEL